MPLAPRRPLCTRPLFLALGLLAATAIWSLPEGIAANIGAVAWRSDFSGINAMAAWGKTSALSTSVEQGVLEMQGTSWDAKMWHSLTLPAGDYLLSGKGSGKLHVYILSNNPFKGGSWGKPLGLINLSGPQARLEERPFHFPGGETILVAHIQGPADKASLSWVEVSPKPAPAAAIPESRPVAAGTSQAEAPHPVSIAIDDQAGDWASVPTAGTLSTVIGSTAPASPRDTAVSFKVAFSDSFLYLYVSVTDDILQFGKKSAPYENDCIELFFDPLLSRSSRYDDSAMQIFVTGDGEGVVAKGKVPLLLKRVPMEGGWAFEAALPLSNDYFVMQPANGLPLGFNISYNDNDSGAGRHHKITWSREDTGDTSWQRTDVFGLIKIKSSSPRALTPTLPSPMVEARRALRTAGEALTNVGVLESQRPEPAVVRGFMTGNLKGPEGFRDMRAWGANVVRWQIIANYGGKRDPDFWRPDHLPAMLDWLEAAISNAQMYGLKMVIDLHGLPTGKPPETAAYWDDPQLEGALCTLWKAIAVRLAPYRKAIWGYDLYNEPLDRGQLPYAPRQWRPLAVKITKAIRTVDPTTWVIYEVGPGGGSRGFDDLLPLPDARVIYSSHFYDPGTFTHQGVSHLMDAGLKVEASPTAVLYPGPISGRDMNKTELENALSGVIAFQQKWRVPIFIGEFSAIVWAPVPSAVAWLTDAIDIFEKYGWSWAYHAFREYPGWSPEHQEGVFPGVGKQPPLATGETARGALLKKALGKNVKSP